MIGNGFTTKELDEDTELMINDTLREPSRIDAELDTFLAGEPVPQPYVDVIDDEPSIEEEFPMWNGNNIV